MHAGAAERIDAHAYALGTDDVEVEDILEIADIALQEIELLRAAGLDGAGERRALDVAQPAFDQHVGARSDPRGGIGIGRATMRWVVLDAAALGRIMRRRDDDAVRATAVAATVMHEDRVRYGGGGRGVAHARAARPPPPS